MLEVIHFGGLELRSLQSKESIEGSLDLFEMTVKPGARVPVAHSMRTRMRRSMASLARAYGASMAAILSWRLGRSFSLSVGSFTASETIHANRRPV